MINYVMNQDTILAYEVDTERRWNSKRGTNEKRVSMNVKIKFFIFKIH